MTSKGAASALGPFFCFDALLSLGAAPGIWSSRASSTMYTTPLVGLRTCDPPSRQCHPPSALLSSHYFEAQMGFATGSVQSKLAIAGDNFKILIHSAFDHTLSPAALQIARHVQARKRMRARDCM